MASYEKIVRYVVERFQESLAPLHKIVENQEKIICQNSELQSTLNKIYQRNFIKADENLSRDEDI